MRTPTLDRRAERASQNGGDRIITPIHPKAIARLTVVEVVVPMPEVESRGGGADRGSAPPIR
jgi:hypothetical protein